MWNPLFNGFRLVHAAIFAFAAFGLFGFWARTRFWLPKYVHLLAGIGLAVGVLAVSAAPLDAPISKSGRVVRLLLMLLPPAMVSFFFIAYGGQRAAFERTASGLAPCPFCQNPQPAESRRIQGGPRKTWFVERQCRQCGQSFPQSAP